ncbi:MAG TPA: PorV/PorQ family protein [Candidatus Deferrimicrobium sp.]|nr:PorV/PorQ family protein [Candidatus Deferrimicrobium sp.]
MKRIVTTGAKALALACLLSQSQVSAKDIHSKAGTSAFTFMKIPVGARAVAMGGAFTGLADDESALYYNPAGISSLEGKRFIAAYHNYFVDIQSGFVGYITQFRENVAIGAWVNYMNYGDFVATDSLGDVTGDFSGGDLVAAVTIASRQNHNFSVGGTIKLIYERIEKYGASGVAADLGVKYTSDRGRLSAGLAVQNLGAQLDALDVEKYRLPLAVRGGVAVRPRAFKLIVAGDLVVPVDNDPIIEFGADYYEFRPFYARVGWNSFGSNYRGADSNDNWAGLSLGMGFDYGRMHIAYAFSPSADLGESHRVTLTGGL